MRRGLDLHERADPLIPLPEPADQPDEDAMQPHDKILSPASLNVGPTTVAWRLACPECAEPGIERGDLDEATGTVPYDAGSDDDSDDADADFGDHTSVTVHPDKDEYSGPLGTRGGWVEVRMWCAAGHAFQLVVANHKGEEYVAVVR